jgi:hypothetical protein
MCAFKAPKITTPAPAPPVERQPVQMPKEMVSAEGRLQRRFRRGFWASVMTSPQGVSGPVSVTGTPAARAR